MKMVKSLLLGSAAGLVAVSAGQAADLPVKAKPVEYVKVCSLYGAGFYYMPGTDICLKIGGYVRAEYTYHSNASSTNTYNSDLNNRITNETFWRARGYITADAREQTAWGTVRAYIAVGTLSTDVGGSSASVFNSNRAFLQWAGFTFGVTQSFYDFYSTAASAYWGNYPASDTGDAGWFVAAYTAQIGNGLSASISAEMRRATQILEFNAPLVAGVATPTLVGGAFTGVVTAPGLGYGGFQAPDIVGNIRIDQTWGSAQVMAAAHEVNPVYYDGVTGGAFNPEPSGHAGDKWGWAAGAGLRLNAPFIAQGDYFQTQVNYAQGALRYFFHSANENYWLQRGDSAAFGILSDAVVGCTTPTSNTTGVPRPCSNGTDVELTTGWNVNASYEHYWTPQFHESVYGGYAEVRYPTLGNAVLCSGEGVGTSSGATAVALPGCNNNWNIWWVGSRLQYDILKSFYMGVDFLYTKIDSAQMPHDIIPVAVIPAGTTTLNKIAADENNFQVRFRVHKDFLP